MQSPVQVGWGQIQEAVIGRFSNSLAMVLNSPITEGHLDMLWPKLYHQSVLCHWNTISNCCRKWMIMSFIHTKFSMKKNENKSYVPSEDGINTDLVKKCALGITRSAVQCSFQFFIGFYHSACYDASLSMVWWAAFCKVAGMIPFMKLLLRSR